MRIIQPSFGAGELSPSLGARVDLAQYKIGAALLENFLVAPQGGVMNRPGTKFVAGTLNNNPARLIPFQFNVVQSYVLEFTDGNMRIIVDGGLVVDGSNNVVVIPSPYAYADLATLKYTQSADTMFLAHPNYPPYMLTRTSDSAWTFTVITFGATIGPPTGLAAMYTNGGTLSPSASIQYQVSSVDSTGQESLPSNPVTVTVDSVWPAGATVNLSWNPVVGAVQYNVYKNSLGFWGQILAMTAGGANTAKLANGVALDNGTLNPNVPGLAFDGDTSTFWLSSQSGWCCLGQCRHWHELSHAKNRRAVSHQPGKGRREYPGYAFGYIPEQS